MSFSLSHLTTGDTASNYEIVPYTQVPPSAKVGFKKIINNDKISSTLKGYYVYVIALFSLFPSHHSHSCLPLHSLPAQSASSTTLCPMWAFWPTSPRCQPSAAAALAGFLAAWSRKSPTRWEREKEEKKKEMTLRVISISISIKTLFHSYSICTSSFILNFFPSFFLSLVCYRSPPSTTTRTWPATPFWLRRMTTRLRTTSWTAPSAIVCSTAGASVKSGQ